MMLRLAARRLTTSSAGAAAVLGRSTSTRARSLSTTASCSSPSMASLRRDQDDHSPPMDERRRRSRATTATPTAIPRTFFSSVSAPPAQQVDVFPSIVIHSTLNAQNNNNGLHPQGSFAEAQAAFLNPPKETIRSLLGQLLKHNIGIVAHYYMDVELQGILHGVKRLQMDLLNRQQQQQQQQQPQQQIPLEEELLEIYRQMGLPPTHVIPAHPLVAIADSLAMGDHAVRMCSPPVSGGAAASSIICLGVDFMSESVAAIMARNGCGHVPVYRAATRHIGCSLAESAESRGYEAWLRKFGDAPSSSSSSSDKKALHVVYINTSLETKATSASILPTITCTSSNVLQTILQASAQVGPDRLQICYGPDTYMGENLKSLLDAILSHKESWTDSRIRDELHPLHTRDSLRHLRDNLHVYPHGNCIVHHMFGNSVVQTVLEKYGDAYVTAHLEVPGEMFQIALEKSMNDEGVVGSTSNILQFIERKVEEAAKEMQLSRQQSQQPRNGSTPQQPQKRRLKFILGTEAGMVTSIVRSVQDILDDHRCHNVEAEIIFPVSSEAVMGVEDDAEGTNDSSLGVVPGVAGGEGCSTAGGCATCPFMKMNDLDAVHDVVDMIQSMRGTGDGNGENNHYRNKVELQLRKHLPPNRLAGKSINGRDAIELGSEPIVFMRHFMKDKVMSDDLVQRIERMGQL